MIQNQQVVLGPAIPQLPSADLDQTEAFFQSALGFETRLKLAAQGFLSVIRGQTEIHFWRTPDQKTALHLGAQSSCYIRVENIRPLFEELKSRRAPFAYELEAKPWGMNEMQVNDPCGNAIRFGEAL